MGNSRVVATMKMTMRLEGGGGKDRDYIAVAGTIKILFDPRVAIRWGGGDHTHTGEDTYRRKKNG